MSETEDVKAFKKLTLAIWILCALTAVNVLISLFSVLFPYYVAKRATAFIASDDKTKVLNKYHDPYEGFYDWPIEKQIKEASVIILTGWEKDDEKLKCIVKEILKIKPGTTFYYEVGQEYASHNRYPKEDTCYGDGEIIFFTGSPGSMRFSTTYKNGRILGMGDMPIELLRKKIDSIK